MSNVRVLLWAARCEIKANAVSPLMLVNAALVPLVLLLLSLSVRSESLQTAPLVWPSLLSGIWGATVWAAGGVLRRERNSGTLARIAASATDPYFVIYGKSLGAVSASIAVASVAAGGFLTATGVSMVWGSPIVIAAAVAVLAVSTAALGSCLACLFLVSRHGLAWSSTLIYPVFALGGLLVPKSNIHPALTWIPDLLSIHWVNRALNAPTDGWPVPVELGVALALGVLYGLVGWYCFHALLNQARRKATLDFV